jgi:hypothetical protein
MMGGPTITLYHRENAEAPNTCNVEMILCGTETAGHCFDLGGTGGVGSGVYCTRVPLPGAGRLLRFRPHRDDMFVIKNMERVTDLLQCNRAMLHALWRLTHGEVDPELASWAHVGAHLARALDVSRACANRLASRVLLVYKGAAVRERLLVAQPLTIALVQMGYAGVMYGGDAEHMNDEYAWGAIVFIHALALPVGRSEMPRRGIRVPYERALKRVVWHEVE